MSITSHPVAQLLRHHAYFGTTPKASELDKLQLSREHRALVRRAADEAAHLHAEGEQGRGHEHALRRSYEIVGDLPEAQQDPRYLHVDPLADAPIDEVVDAIQRRAGRL